MKKWSWGVLLLLSTGPLSAEPVATSYYSVQPHSEPLPCYLDAVEVTLMDLQSRVHLKANLPDGAVESCVLQDREADLQEDRGDFTFELPLTESRSLYTVRSGRLEADPEDGWFRPRLILRYAFLPDQNVYQLSLRAGTAVLEQQMERLTEVRQAPPPAKGSTGTGGYQDLTFGMSRDEAGVILQRVCETYFREALDFYADRCYRVGSIRRDMVLSFSRMDQQLQRIDLRMGIFSEERLKDIDRTLESKYGFSQGLSIQEMAQTGGRPGAQLLRMYGGGSVVLQVSADGQNSQISVLYLNQELASRMISNRGGASVLYQEL